MALSTQFGKIAVVWPGTTRNPARFADTYNCCIKRSLENMGYTVHLYVSSYSGQDFDEFVELYRPYKYETVDRDIFLEETNTIIKNLRISNLCKFANPPNLVSMYRHMHKTYHMIESSEYDYVVRWRDNVYLDRPISKEWLDLATTGFVIPRYGDWTGGMNDIFCIGTYENMEYYLCNTMDHLQQWLDEGAWFNPEHLIMQAILRSGVPIFRVNAHLYVVRRNTLYHYTVPSATCF